MTLQCHGARVIVQPDPEYQSSVLTIPPEYKKFSDRGTLVAVGPGRRHIDGKIYPLSVKVGDRVIYSLVRGHKFSNGDTKLVAMEEDDILAVIASDDKPLPNN